MVIIFKYGIVENFQGREPFSFYMWQQFVIAGTHVSSRVEDMDSGRGIV